jgi:hypothetical protein
MAPNGMAADGVAEFSPMKYCLHYRERQYETMARKDEEATRTATTRKEEEAAHNKLECPPRLTVIAATIQQWAATAMDRLFSLAGQMMGHLGGLAQLVGNQAVFSTYQALEAATIVYAAVSHRASNENPNGSLARNNFIWADLTDQRDNEYANNNNIENPCHLEKYHLGFSVVSAIS